MIIQYLHTHRKLVRLYFTRIAFAHESKLFNTNETAPFGRRSNNVRNIIITIIHCMIFTRVVIVHQVTISFFCANELSSVQRNAVCRVHELLYTPRTINDPILNALIINAFNILIVRGVNNNSQTLHNYCPTHFHTVFFHAVNTRNR